MRDPPPPAPPSGAFPTPPSAHPRAFSGYHTLMRHRVQEILLVASPYDAFALEEDGQFSQRLFAEYLELNLSSAPHFTQVTTARAALDHLRNAPTDLVVCTPHCADRVPLELVAAVKRAHPQLPVVMLAYDRLTAQSYAEVGPPSGLDEVFLWSGDPRLLLALVKVVEDRLNVARDTRKNSVRVIVVVEDAPAFYSAYLPILYTELLSQTHALMAEGLNAADRIYRARARPKILLARTYEEGARLLGGFRDYLLGVVMDMGFPRDGTRDPAAGRALIQALRAEAPDVPVLLQSADPAHAAIAAGLGVSFAPKASAELLERLRDFMRDQLGFGPFVFRLPDGAEVARARDIRELTAVLATVPEASIRWHAERNHFSGWLMTRCEFPLAARLRPWRLSDFASVAEARRRLIEALAAHLVERQRGQVTDWTPDVDPLRRDFTRLGRGSMGGKARGIAFAAAQLADHPIHARYPAVRIGVPRTTVLCTDAFAAFTERHRLRESALAGAPDAEITRRFLAHPLPDDLTADLAALLRDVRHPLAVRSSSLFEDSALAPLAGLYETVLLPNGAADPKIRLAQLATAIRLVWASTFYAGPRAYLAAAGLRHEEEAMAGLVQRVVGSRHGARFYPDVAGVAQSRNLYPIGDLTPEDGVATVALGLGHTVVDGGLALRFAPRRPLVLPQLASRDAALRSLQREFRALDCGDPGTFDPAVPTVRSYDLAAAEADGTLDAVGSTYVPDDDRIVDSLGVAGTRLVSFAPVLKYDRFPLAPVLADLLRLGVEGLGSDVELEFAVALDGPEGRPELGVLQLRPQLGLTFEQAVSAVPRPGEAPWLAGAALGAGTVGGLRDVVYVHPSRWDTTATSAMATVIAGINARLVADGRPYLLAAPGRWGTADRFLGIPVAWPQVSGARVIVELAGTGFRIDPSQGTHFFHNLTSLNLGYLTVDLARDGDVADLAWLEALPPVHAAAGVRHVVLPVPCEARLDHRTRRGIVVRAADPAGPDSR